MTTGLNIFRLLAGETFLVVDLFDCLVAAINFAEIRYGHLTVPVVRHDFRTLNRFGTTVIEALHALFPGLKMQLMEVAFMDVRR